MELKTAPVAARRFLRALPPGGIRPPRRLGLLVEKPPHRWQRYAGGLALLLLATLISTLVGHWISPANVVMIYLLAVVLASVYFGRGAAVLVSVFGVLSFDFFIVPPRLDFAVSDTQYLLSFLGLLVVGLVISQLTTQLYAQLETVRTREAELSILYSLSRDLAVSGNRDEIMRSIIDNVSQNLGRQVVVLLPDGGGQLQSAAHSDVMVPDKDDLSVATWAFEHGQPAGRGATTHSDAKVRYLPLKTAHGVLGVMGIGSSSNEELLTPSQKRLLESFASLAALSIERAELEETARNAELLKATERLQSSLLNSISHDLRTPLVSITGVLTSLQDDSGAIDDATRASLIETAREDADRLNRLVGNLLDMTRIESGAVKVVREPSDVQDLVGTALEQLGDRLAGRPIHIDVPENLPLVPLGFGLIVQVLLNLIDNANKYSPAGTPIDLSARIHDDQLEIIVADRGIGIPREDLSRVFDKFYRVRRPQKVAGTGMGLAICKGFVEAHGGRITAENREGGGTTIRIRIPVQEPEAAQRGK